MIYCITGEERSEKSSDKQQLAEELSTTSYHLETAKIWDNDFQKKLLPKIDTKTKYLEAFVFFKQFIIYQTVIKHYKIALFFCTCFLVLSCQKEVKKQPKITKASSLKYATGFQYKKYKNHIHITIPEPYKGARVPQEYFLIKKDTQLFASKPNQTIIHIPIQKIVATSTTQIPVLEALNSEKLLKGFPNTRYISSLKTRHLIDQKQIIDIGQEEQPNTELVLGIQPDAFFSFAVNNYNKHITTLKNAKIPVVVDASWLEKTPLGRAEWITFFGLFLNKEKEAKQIFRQIENNYKNAIVKVKKSKQKPNILYGSLFNGVWYAPAGESYIAQILKDAHTHYLWQDTSGRGSLSLSFEEVFIKAQEATYWLAPENAKTELELVSKNKHYTQFPAYQNHKIYSYSNTTGATGGLLFFELGDLRPDLILRDIIQICHPDLLPNYKPTFFSLLN